MDVLEIADKDSYFNEKGFMKPAKYYLITIISEAYFLEKIQLYNFNARNLAIKNILLNFAIYYENRSR